MSRFMAQLGSPTAGLLLVQGEGVAGAFVLRPGCRCISEGSHPGGSAPGARREGAGSNPGIGGLPPIPSNTGRGLPSTCLSTGDGAHCCRGGWFPCLLFFFGGG